MKISIIIINYNTPNLVLDCLESIKNNLVNINFEVIVVDNGSKAESRIQNDKFKKMFPSLNFQLLTLQTNIGFGGGNNFGAKYATGEILWFLNSDTIVPENNNIEMIIEKFNSDTKVGILSPVLYNDLVCKNIQPDFFANFQSLRSIVLRKPKSNQNFQDNFFETDVVVGASLFIRRKVFEQIEGFDQNIFMFMEDDDLCFRTKELGYKVLVAAKARIVHLQGKSIKRSKQRKRLYYKSQNYFWRKNYGFWPTLLMRLIRWPYKIIRTNLK